MQQPCAKEDFARGRRWFERHLQHIARHRDRGHRLSRNAPGRIVQPPAVCHTPTNTQPVAEGYNVCSSALETSFFSSRFQRAPLVKTSARRYWVSTVTAAGGLGRRGGWTEEPACAGDPCGSLRHDRGRAEGVLWLVHKGSD